MRPFIIIFLFSFIVFSCKMNQTMNVQTGTWRATLQLPGGELPFNFELKKDNHEKIFMEIINAEERIRVDEVEIKGDSVFITPPVFDTEIKAKISQGVLEGTWTDYSRKGNYVIPFRAESGKSFRFTDTQEKPVADISGKWEADFLGDSSKAIAELMQKGNYLEGTFLTPTGDYRYLEGTVQRDSLFLSCFDGSHAFLFKAKINTDSTLDGKFWSGTHHHDKWLAKRNEHFSLPNPDTLTYLKPGFEKFTFSFPNLDSQVVSLEDERYKNKVVIVQIMGSWCPNCMDESAFLSDFYRKNKNKGIEIIGLAFERTTEFGRVKKNLERLKKQYGIKYEILFAGSSKLEESSKALPMLNQIMSYPTTIFIDKKGKVRRIHTGYSGPATGKHYEDFVREFNQLMDTLIAE